jgi:hypothetical protein
VGLCLLLLAFVSAPLSEIVSLTEWDAVMYDFIVFKP